MNRSVCLMFCNSVLATVLAVSDASAQTYGTDYISFKGWGVILDNPISTACANDGFASNDRFEIVYRFSANTGNIVDALTFRSEDGSVFRIVSASTLSLNSASFALWQLVDRRGNFSSIPANQVIQTNLTILSGANAPVTLGTGNIKITNGHIGAFFGGGCNITNFHGAAVALPD